MRVCAEDGPQRHRGGGCRRRRGWDRGAGGSMRPHRLPGSSRCGRGSAAGPGRPTMAGISRSISAAAGCIRPTAIPGERLPRPKGCAIDLDAAALEPHFGSDRLSAVRAGELSCGARAFHPAGRARSPSDAPDIPRRDSCSSRCGRWNALINAVGTYVSGSRARARVDAGFQSLPRQRRELAGGRGTAARGPPMASWSS